MSTYSPFALRMTQPMRSASGSDAMTMSAFVSFAFAIAIAIAEGTSGLGDSTVGKSPEGTSCSGTWMILVNP